MSTESEELKKRIANALAAREPLAAPFETVDEIFALPKRLGLLPGTGRGVWQRYREAASPPVPSDDDTDSLLQRAFGWYWVTEAARGGELAEEALERAIAAKSAYGCIQALVLLALTAADRYRFAEAISTLLEALHFHRQESVPGAEAGLLTNLAKVFAQMELHACACEVAALALRTALREDDDDALADVLNAIGDAYRMRAHHDDMLRFATLAMDAAPLGGPLVRGMVLTSYASALYRVGRLDEALASCVEAHEWSTRHYDLQNACRSLLLMGTIHSARGELSSALDAYHRTIDLGHETGSLHIQADAFSSVGHVYLELGDGENALDCLREAVRIRKSIGTFAFNGTELLFFPACYRLLGKTKEAIDGLEVMLPLAVATGQIGLLLRVLIDLGQTHREQGDTDLAHHYLREAVKAADSLSPESRPRSVPPAWLQLATLHRERGDRTSTAEAVRGLEAACPEGIPDLLLPEYYRLLSWLEAGSDPEAARAVLLEGIRQLESLRHRLPQAIPRQLGALASAEQLFEALLELGGEEQDPTALYLLCQHARARRFLDLVSKAEWTPPLQVPAELALTERNLLAELRVRLADLTAPQEIYWEAIDQVEADRRLEELTALWARISESAPAYVQMRQAVIPPFSDLIRVLG